METQIIIKGWKNSSYPIKYPYQCLMAMYFKKIEYKVEYCFGDVETKMII
jgi:hypothetical protein